MSWAWEEFSIVFASLIEFSSCACSPDCCRAAPAACWNFAMAGWLSEFLKQESSPVDAFLNLDFDSDENSDDLFPDGSNDDSWDIPETRADSDDKASIPNGTDSESE